MAISALGVAIRELHARGLAGALQEPLPGVAWCSVDDSSTWEELEEWRTHIGAARRRSEWDPSVCPVKIELRVGRTPSGETPTVRLFAFH